MLRGVLLGTVYITAALSALSAHAADSFYKGKTVKIITSTGAGGGYDTIARAVARHMPDHLAGAPSMVVQNMPGGGNVLATNYMANLAPRDGTVIATINNGIPLHQVIDNRGVRYDADKFQWLGSTGAENEVVVAWHTTGVKTIQDAMEKQIVVGGTGPASSIVIFPTVLNNVVGTKFKIVIGYKSSSAVSLALERGEIQARSGSFGTMKSQHDDWIKGKKVNFLVQVGAKRDKALPDVPLLTELAKTDEQRRILKLISSPILLGRPYLAPPGVPADRVGVLRNAFMATLKDGKFLAEMKKLDIDIDPIPGEEVAAIVHDTVTAPPNVVAKAKAAMPHGEKKKH